MRDAGIELPRERTLMNALAFVSKPKVVCLLDSGPNGTISFNFSRQLRKWARLQMR